MTRHHSANHEMTTPPKPIIIDGFHFRRRPKPPASQPVREHPSSEMAKPLQSTAKPLPGPPLLAQKPASAPSAAKSLEDAGKRKSIHEGKLASSQSLNASGSSPIRNGSDATRKSPRKRLSMNTAAVSGSLFAPSAETPHQSQPVSQAALPPQRKRRKICRKAYASISASLPEETRLRILVENFLKKEYADAALQTPAISAQELAALQNLVVDAVEAASEQERIPESERLSKLQRPKAANRDLQRREVQLQYIIDRYADELKCWEDLERDIPSKSVGESGVPVLPPIPPVDSIVGVPPVENKVPISDAVESYVLHTDDLNRTLKRLEVQHGKASRIVAAISQSINANAFEGGPRLNLDYQKVAPSPSPIPRRPRQRRRS